MSSRLPATSHRLSLYIAFVGLVIIGGAFTIRAFPIILGIGTVIALVALRGSYREKLGGVCRVTVTCLGMIAICVLSTFWSVAPSETFERAMKLIPLFVLGIGFWMITPKAHDVMAHPALALWPVALLIGAAFVLTETLSGLPIYRWMNNLDAGDPAVHPNIYNKELGFLLFSAVPITALMIRAGKGWWMAGPLVVLGACLVTMTNQSLQVAVPVMMIIAATVWIRSPRPVAWIMGGVTLVGLAGAPFIAPWLFGTLIQHMQGEWLHQASAAMRLEIWDFVARQALERPWLGHGMEAARFITFDSQTLYFPTATIMHPHNGALQIWLEFGVMGVLLFGGLWIGALRAIQTQCLMLVLVAGLSVAFFLTWGLWQSWWLACIFFTLGLARLYEGAVAPRNASSATSHDRT